MSSASNQQNSFGQHDFTTVYLESQINAAAGLNSPKEYKFWIMTFARYLIENGYFYSNCFCFKCELYFN